MERATPAVDSAAIRIFSLRSGRKAFVAIKDHQTPFNIITKACIEQLEMPWYQFNGKVNYKLNSHASPPIGYGQLAWTWEGCEPTWDHTFIVVEMAACDVILGASGSQMPRTVFGGVFPTNMAKQSKGSHSKTTYGVDCKKHADTWNTEEADSQRLAGQQSAARQPDEKALQDAKNKENREREKKKRQDNNRNA